MTKIPFDSNFLYDSLARTLRGAYNQASKGKGKERHATDEPFEEQKICVINRWIADSPVAGALFQAIKKTVESSRLDEAAAIRELQGAINYLAAAIILLEEGTEKKTEQEPEVITKFCSDCLYYALPVREMPCKKCWRWDFRPHWRPVD